MATKDFFELIKQALPADLRPSDLIKLAPEHWWIDKPRLAAIYALRKCPRINWDAYRERNNDVKQSGMDPCLHYIKHGVYEGRKLVSWHPLKEEEADNSPLVSVLIANYNNELYLEKCIQSVMSQTLKDIEIIIVDDGSTDRSPSLIKNLIAADSRIRAIFNEKNGGLVNARRKGVEAASGRYIMFLDSDDYMNQNACAIAVGVIEKGYDLVKFGASVINTASPIHSRAKDIEKFLNFGKPGEYSREELIDSMFFERDISWHVWTNIYLREICLYAYRELENGYFNHPEDAYAMTAITRYIRNAAKIDSRLYNYNVGLGISTTRNKEKLFVGLDDFLSTCKAIKAYIYNNGIENKYRMLLDNLCHDAVEKLILSESAESDKQFKKIADVFGVDIVLKYLIENYNSHKNKLIKLIPELPKNEYVENIGIFYPHRTPGGIERWVGNMSQALTEAGHKVTVFSEFRTDYDLPLPKDVDIWYLPPFGKTIESQVCRIRNLGMEAKRRKIKLMIHAGTRFPCMLWDLMRLQYSDIPVILAYHYDEAHRILTHSAQGEEDDAVFRKASAVFCFSKAEERRMRSHAINASCVKKSCKNRKRIERKEIPAKVAVMGRFGDPLKQIEEDLKVLHCIVSQAPNVTMHFIGDFYTREQRKKFEKKVKIFDLQKNVRMYGWVTEPERILSECGVFLSTAKWGVAPSGIAEAQVLGLPVVMYDLPIETPVDYDNIYKVSQGDAEGAADKIMHLLKIDEA